MEPNMPENSPFFEFDMEQLETLFHFLDQSEDNRIGSDKESLFIQIIT